MTTAAGERSRPDAKTTSLGKAHFQALLDLLWSKAYRVIGPTVSQGAIIYDEIRAVDDLPRGWTDEQSGGKYRLQRRDDDAWFGFVVGPHSWKRYLFPPKLTVAQANRTPDGWQMVDVPDDEPAYAFIGVRACELAAIAVQDRTFINGQYVDPVYRRRRERALIVAVNCTQAASTCFCTSMNTGPRCQSGFDLALTELPDRFTVEVGSVRGAEIMAQLPTTVASPKHLKQAEAARQQAVDQISKHLDTTDIRDLLLGNLEHARWSEVATRCLSCTNCTMVCPTCFCSSVTEVSDLNGDHVDRVRQWDSCFNWDFSYMNGAVVRDQIRSRYRQWLTHKLASWIDQFDVSGCVGCGRCITWCPVGIDLTEEVAAIRETPS
ncbi:MAG: 4Fe-4S dicluster domain-containing protein [Pirellulales bacterium]